MASAAVIPVSVMAFNAPEPDNGAAGAISSGGEWSIYASKSGFRRPSVTGDSIKDTTNDNGVVEVNGGAEMSAQFQFDMASMLNNGIVGESGASNKVVKSAKLRLTSVVAQNANILHQLYTVNNEFNTVEGKTPVGIEFKAPRGDNNDFNKSSVKDVSAEGLTSYPEELSVWQTAADITGLAVTSADTLSLSVDYSGGNTSKVEYATCNIDKNGRLNGGAVPFLYNGGTTDYSKWVYPQIVLEYSDSETYKGAYADFINAYTELSEGIVTEENGVVLSEAQNGSAVALEMYGSSEKPIKVEGQNLVFNEEYVGNDTFAYVKLTVTKTEGDENAVYSRVVSVPAEYTKQHTISFDSSKNPKGELSIMSGGKIYTDGTAYGKQGSVFNVNVTAGVGYNAKVEVKTADGAETILPNTDGSYTMPDGDASVSVEYSKKTFGTSRIAAVSSMSVKADGNTQGNGGDVIIGADRFTFLKFDLSDYNVDVISSAMLGFTKNKGTSNTKAIFYIPNNDWSEANFSKDFCIDGTEDTKLSAFKKEDGTTVAIYAGDDRKTRMVPETTGKGDDDLSAAANGILGRYYLTSSGTSKSDSITITEAVKEAVKRSGDGVITLLVYSTGGSGGDMRSVTSAASVNERPYLMITESAEYLPDDQLVTEINTIEDLERFSAIVNGGNNYGGKTVTLENDLDLSVKYNQTGSSWEEIGTQDIGGIKPFAGTFEGGNHSITGLYINDNNIIQGLFGIVTGTIQNLTVAGEINGSSVIGGIAAQCGGKITNCRSRVNITAQREAGGIVGTLSGGVISESDNEGNILLQNKETYAGGIAGHNIGGVIEKCNNSGKIENDSDGFRNKIGGIAGFLDNGEIHGSHNTGDIVSSAETASYTADTSQNYVGGIVGYSSYGIITDSDNSGVVYNAADYAGGIAGLLQNECLVSDCINNGTVSGQGYVGGIAGCNFSSIINSSNEAAVLGMGDYIGGVAGYLSTGILNNCMYNKALNADLDIVGFNSEGKITDDTVPTEDSVKYDNGDAVAAVKSAGKYTLIFAAYGGADELLCVDSQIIEFSGAGKDTFSPSVSFNENGAKTIKVMLWNELNNMRPLCATDTVLKNNE